MPVFLRILILIGRIIVPYADKVLNQGLIMDKRLTFKDQKNKIYFEGLRFIVFGNTAKSYFGKFAMLSVSESETLILRH